MKILFSCAEFPTAFCLIKAVLTVKRHPERMWRIYYRGEEDGKVSSG